MRRAAVICEFNPFHNGHKFLLEKVKNEYADEIICIMSGNFVQRGDIAITDKYARAKAALEHGADLVVELPTAYAVAGAHTFADNGVRLAAAMRCDVLCFGAEDSLNDLSELAEMLEHRPVNEMIHTAMRSGQYFPKALGIAVGDDYAAMIKRPNNILALEYIKACKQYSVRPIAIERKGVSHDDDRIVDDIASGSKIRSLIGQGEDYRRLTPMTIGDPCTLMPLEPAILYRLKTITPAEFSRIADISEGLENRILEVSKWYHSLSEILTAVKTKRYTMARLRRIILSAFLDITAKDQQTPVPYCRVLGLRSGKEAILSDADLPLIVKTRTDYDKLDISAKEIFDIDLRASEAMNLANGQTINEFSQPIIKV